MGSGAKRPAEQLGALPQPFQSDTAAGLGQPVGDRARHRAVVGDREGGDVGGVPDERLGEVCAAYVQAKEGQSLDQDAVVTHCRERLANYKVPRHVWFVDEFPTTATGKIQKYRLREEAIEALGLQQLAERRLIDYRAPAPPGRVGPTVDNRRGA